MVSQKITIAGQEKEVYKLPLRKYAELFKIIKRITVKINADMIESNEKMIAAIPDIIENSWDELVDIICLGTNLTKEEINGDVFGLNEVVDVGIALMEQNNYSEIYAKIKKKMAGNQN